LLLELNGDEDVERFLDEEVVLFEAVLLLRGLADESDVLLLAELPLELIPRDALLLEAPALDVELLGAPTLEAVLLDAVVLRFVLVPVVLLAVEPAREVELRDVNPAVPALAVVLRGLRLAVLPLAEVLLPAEVLLAEDDVRAGLLRAVVERRAVVDVLRALDLRALVRPVDLVAIWTLLFLHSFSSFQWR
jgi:hypothetical protein